MRTRTAGSTAGATAGARVTGRAAVALALAVGILALLAACGGDEGITDPTDVTLGETTFVFLVNPVVNDANQKSVPSPGPEQSGVDVAVQDGPSAFTDDGGAAEMAKVEYAFSGEVVVITPDMSVEDVNDALSDSDIIVLVEGGTYAGNVDFSGSNVTLFGEGAEGGNVTIDGDVVVSGSQNRLRGVRVTGDLSVPGSNAAVSFSSVAGSLTVDGSDVRLLDNAFCGSIEVTGGGLLALGNAGLEPVPPPDAGY